MYVRMAPAITHKATSLIFVCVAFLMVFGGPEAPWGGPGGANLLKKHRFALRKAVLFEFRKGLGGTQGMLCRVGGWSEEAPGGKPVI